jgi:hypothetical protein
MSGRHLIEQLDFGIEFEAPEPRLGDEGYLAELVQATLLPIVDEVFEACDEPGTVLTLPSLSVDLGEIPRDRLREEAAARLRVVLRDALDAARRAARTGQPPVLSALSVGEATADFAAPYRRSEEESDLARLAAFLATGRLPWHAALARRHNHVELLDRLLERAGAGLREMLARMLGRRDGPFAARRLAEQFPERQLRALLRLSAPAGIPMGSSSDAEVGEEGDGRVSRDAVARWERLLADGFSGRTARGGEARRGSVLRETMTDWYSSIDALARFLRTGRLDPATELAGLESSGAQYPARGVDAADPVQVRLLARALAGPAEPLWEVLRAALADPGSARRLAEQFPATLLAEVVRRSAPGQAEALLGLTARLLATAGARRLTPAQVARLVWPAVLMASLRRPGHPVEVGTLWTAIEASLPAPAAATVAAAAAAARHPAGGDSGGAAWIGEDLVRLSADLRRGVPYPAPARSRMAQQSELLERLLKEADGARLAPALRAVLVSALASGDGAQRLVVRFPERLLDGVLRLLAPLLATRFGTWMHALRSAALAGGVDGARLDGLLSRAWEEVLLACATAPGMAVAERALRSRLDDLLAEVGADGDATTVSGSRRRDRRLSRRARRVLAKVGAVRQDGKGRPDGGDGGGNKSAVSVAGGLPRDRHTGMEVGRSASGRGARPGQSGKGESNGIPDASLGARTASGDGSALARLASFLLSGRLDSAGEGNEAHVALLDSLLAAPGKPLWDLLAEALARPDSARRLIEQFPERQLRELVRLAVPERCAELFELVADVHWAGLERQVAVARLRLVLWSALLSAVTGELSRGGHAPLSIAAVRTAVLAGLPELAAAADEGPVPQAPPGLAGPRDEAAKLAAILAGEADGVVDALTLQRLLAQEPDVVLAGVRKALIRTERTRELVRMFGEAPLRALVLAAGGRSGELLELAGRIHGLVRARPGYPLAEGWRQLLLAALAEAGALEPAALRARLLGATVRLRLQAVPRGGEPALAGSVAATAPASPTVPAIRDAGAAPVSWQLPAPEQQAARAIRRLLAAAAEARTGSEALGDAGLPGADAGASGTGAAAIGATDIGTTDSGTADSGTTGIGTTDIGLTDQRHGGVLATERSGDAVVMAEQLLNAKYVIEHRLSDQHLTVTQRDVVNVPGPRAGIRPDEASPASTARPHRHDGYQRGLPLTLASRRRLAERVLAETAALEVALAQRVRPSVPAPASAHELGLVAARLRRGEELPELADMDQASLRALVAAVLEEGGQVAAHHRAAMLESIEAAAARSAAPRTLLAAAVRALARGEALDLDAAAAPSRPGAPAELRGAIAEALMAGEAGPLPPSWRTQFERHRSLALAALRAFGRSPALRKVLAQRLPLPILVDLVGMLAAPLAAMLREAAPVAGSEGRRLWTAAFLALLEPNAPRLIDEPAARRILARLPGMASRTTGRDEAQALVSSDAGSAARTAASVQQDARPATEGASVRPGAIRHAAAGADAADARRRLDALLAARTGTAMLAAAIEAQLKEAPDAAVFLHLVADALDAGEALDLDAILARCRVGAGHAEAREPGKPGASAQPNGVTRSDQEDVAVARVAATPPGGSAGSAPSGEAAPEPAPQSTPAAPAGFAGTARSRPELMTGTKAGIDRAARPDPAAHADVASPTHIAAPGGASTPVDAVPATDAATPATPSERNTTPPRSESRSLSPSPDASPAPGAPEGERIPLINAGLVLATPYLPRLFSMLGLLREGGFASQDAAERAVHLMQYLASGQSSTPEYQLVLNKLLCGLPLDAPVPSGIELEENEREIILSLLKAMIASWSALGNTSVDGLRQSFLMREGELMLEGEAWQLSVVPGPFDMLMDRLPWSFSIIKFAWMALPLHVSWH